MHKQLRQDLICEKMRSTQEIRNELAKNLRVWRKFRETPDYQSASITMMKIRILKWVLRHDKILDKPPRGR